MLFFTNTWMARQSIEQARSIAMCTPPRIDMCAPRRIFFVMSSQVETSHYSFPNSQRFLDCARNDKRLEPLRVPIGLLQTSFADVFEEFVNRREQDARALSTDTDIEVELVVEKMNVAIAQQPKKPSRGIEIFRVNDPVLDRETGVGRMGNAVTRSGNNSVQDSGERTKNRNGKDVALRYFNLPPALHQSRIGADAAEIIRAAERALRCLIAIIQISQTRKIRSRDRDPGLITRIIPGE